MCDYCDELFVVCGRDGHYLVESKLCKAGEQIGAWKGCAYLEVCVRNLGVYGCILTVWKLR